MRRSDDEVEGGAAVEMEAVTALGVRPLEQRAAAGRWLVIPTACDELLGRLSLLGLVRGRAERDDGLKILV